MVASSSKQGIVLFHPDDMEYNPAYRPRSASLTIGKIHSIETHTTRASLHDKPRRRGSSNFTDDVDFVDDCPVLQEPSKLHDKWKLHFTRLWLKLLRAKA
ncbi:hypothetical protein SDRG_13153 [Saprolegnia diclina VS20]|uniref:Uncharacterized protein n=1 Tax=Saprolegnia diclina (strain VS20) TaxID=1156394 RepID=T0RH37_SAPDV|nr:hypothetical protein SDRG_13153 [Saprolegnia diclina VS20]EQC29122.1 hypothetical protein SDRG_13153 [Saprolegnia diclina VS20]|eukprot:XP_008617457.1 hypothetical protein SDRG_13153 [Saprolegnia diclina VS20]